MYKMVKKKHKRKLVNASLVVLIIAGLALIVLSDAFCEWLRGLLGSNANMILASVVVIAVLGLIGYNRKVLSAALRQLGGD